MDSGCFVVRMLMVARWSVLFSLDSDTGMFLDSFEAPKKRNCGFSTFPRMSDMLEQEIGNVREIALHKTLKLRTAPDIHCGLEIFHLFVLDLLGVRNLLKQCS